MLRSAWMRAGAGALCAVLALGAPLQATAQSREDAARAASRGYDQPSSAPTSDGPYDQPPPKNKKKDKPSPWWLAIPIGAGVACAATDCLNGKKSTSSSAPSRGDLLESGPRAPTSWPVGAYPIYGFIRNDWPIVVDYSSRPDSITSLTVSVEGRPVWSARLESGDHYAKIFYNGAAAPGSKVALITVQSQAPSTSGPGQPLPVQVRGIGAGPRAVGSVAINNLAFALSGRQVGGDFARFGYVAEGNFSKVNMEILRFTQGQRNGRQVIDAALVAEFREGAVPAGPFGPRMWNGLDSRRSPSRGAHRLQVRGWEVEDDESWVSAISDAEVQVP